MGRLGGRLFTIIAMSGFWEITTPFYLKQGKKICGLNECYGRSVKPQLTIGVGETFYRLNLHVVNIFGGYNYGGHAVLIRLAFSPANDMESWRICMLHSGFKS